MADYLVQEEDGTSRLTEEDGAGSLLLEESVAAVLVIGDGECGVTLENGDLVELEDESGLLLLESCVTQAPVGGVVRVLPRQPRRRKIYLHPPVAVVRVNAYPPRLTITVTAAPAELRARMYVPRPVLVFNPATRTTDRLGELPASRLEDINMILLIDK